MIALQRISKIQKICRKTQRACKGGNECPDNADQSERIRKTLQEGSPVIRVSDNKTIMMESGAEPNLIKLDSIDKGIPINTNDVLYLTGILEMIVPTMDFLNYLT